MRAADAGRLVRAALADASLVERLKAASRVHVVAVGKAAGPMLNAFAEALSSLHDPRPHFLHVGVAVQEVPVAPVYERVPGGRVRRNANHGVTCRFTGPEAEASLPFDHL